MSDWSGLASQPYTVLYRLDRDTDGSLGYIAWHPDLPGCMSDGDTPQEAIENLADARRLYIESLLEDGLPVPEPRPFATHVLFQSTPANLMETMNPSTARPELSHIRQIA